MYWASTETSYEFYGYMEGAVRSGIRSANDILNKIKKENKNSRKRNRRSVTI